MTRITRHLRGGEHVTIIRAPGEPMPAWLGPSIGDAIVSHLESIRIAPPGSDGRFPCWPIASWSGDGEDIALPPLEDEA